MRILPAAQRDAMFEIYAFCRAVDDIADEEGPRDERQAALARWRADIDAIADGATPAPLTGLARTTRVFGLRREDFQAVIDGMQMDLDGPIRAPDWATLDLYCDRVASAVGRLSVRVFGVGEAEGRALAHALGRALQLTNILRDVDEDAGIGRLYLPREALDAAGVASRDPTEAVRDPRLGAACEWVAVRARGYFDEAQTIMRASPRRATRAPRLMAAAYRAILDAMSLAGWRAPRARVTLSPLHKLGLVLRHAIL